MFAKSLLAGLLTVGFLSATFAVDAEAGPRRGKNTQTQTTTINQLGTAQPGAQSGSMDSWPQTMDELTNAYNCGPYADRESAKKCKE